MGSPLRTAGLSFHTACTGGEDEGRGHRRISSGLMRVELSTLLRQHRTRDRSTRGRTGRVSERAAYAGAKASRDEHGGLRFARQLARSTAFTAEKGQGREARMVRVLYRFTLGAAKCYAPTTWEHSFYVKLDST